MGTVNGMRWLVNHLEPSGGFEIKALHETQLNFFHFCILCGAYPSCHWESDKVYSGQVAIPSQGHTDANSHAH